MSTVTPSPQADEPRMPEGATPGWLAAIFDLIKWTLSDHRRAGWAFLFLLAALGAAVACAWVLGPSLGGLVGSSAIGGGVGVSAAAVARRRHRRRGGD